MVLQFLLYAFVSCLFGTPDYGIPKTLRTFHFFKEQFRFDLTGRSGVGVKPIPQGAEVVEPYRLRLSCSTVTT
ncbi:MAG: hypothetical protein IPL59_23550 [Candidatus Competibacteraceae bacterium]|nr:hypothetical protein [Candidatus Competibacteraceae bacterium]